LLRCAALHGVSSKANKQKDLKENLGSRVIEKWATRYSMG